MQALETGLRQTSFVLENTNKEVEPSNPIADSH